LAWLLLLLAFTLIGIDDVCIHDFSYAAFSLPWPATPYLPSSFVKILMILLLL
jgi:hypothetical protein